VLATYSHLHARGCPAWAAGLVARAGFYRREREDAGARVGILCDSDRVSAGIALGLESGLGAKSGN